MRTFDQKPKLSGALVPARAITFGNAHTRQAEPEQPKVESNDRKTSAATSVVNEGLRSTGQPLDTATRTFMESRFGHDFSQVRVHNDAKAMESARQLNADAYTVGSDIVFGAGQFQPETQTGRHLLSHELTHVVQQQHSHAPFTGEIGLPEDSHERQAGAVADALMRGTNIASFLNSGASPIPLSIQRQPRRGTTPPVQPFTYDRTVHNVAPVGRGQTVTFLKGLLVNEIRHGNITSYTTRGGSGNNEIFLLSLIVSLSNRSQWGKESDLVTPVDWPAKAGDPDPLGRVTVRIDSNGAASAELIARGGVPPVAQQTSAATLQTTYNLAAVTTEGSANWSPVELNDVGAAFAMLPTSDKTALTDVELIRVATISGKPGDGGQFEFPNPAAVNASAANIHAKLRLANRAFANDNLQFFGDATKNVPASFQTILHEVGHAVESEVYRTKWRAHAQALADTKAAGQVQESASRQAERRSAQEKLDKATTTATKKRWQQKIGKFDADLAQQSDVATDQKAQETNLKAKEAEVIAMDTAGQSDRLKKFMTLVNNNHILPITDYAATGDREFYAEAYSLWLTDRTFMRNNYRVIFEFFENGDYRR